MRRDISRDPALHNDPEVLDLERFLESIDTPMDLMLDSFEPERR